MTVLHSLYVDARRASPHPGIQAVKVNKFYEPIFNTAACLQLDQGFLSMFVFLWIILAPGWLFQFPTSLCFV